MSFYPPDNRTVLLSDLAATLKAIVSQRLVRSAAGGRLPALEVLTNTRHISEMIEQGRLTEIKDAMDQSLAPGSCTFDHALARLVRAKQIARADALAHADSPTNLLWLLENEANTPASEARSGQPKPASTPVSAAAASAAIAAAAAPKPSPEARDESGEGPSFSEFLLNI